MPFAFYKTLFVLRIQKYKTLILNELAFLHVNN